MKDSRHKIQEAWSKYAHSVLFLFSLFFLSFGCCTYVQSTAKHSCIPLQQNQLAEWFSIFIKLSLRSEGQADCGNNSQASWLAPTLEGKIADLVFKLVADNSWSSTLHGHSRLSFFLFFFFCSWWKARPVCNNDCMQQWLYAAMTTVDGIQY